MFRLVLFIAIGLLVVFILKKKKKQIFLEKKVKNYWTNRPPSAKKFICHLSNSTPTNCILRDNKLYGEHYKNKIPPALCKDCKCELLNKKINYAAFDNNGGNDPQESRLTDMGYLPLPEYNYYRCSILSGREDLEDTQRAYFAEKMSQYQVTEDFQNKIASRVSPTDHSQNGQ